MDISTLKLRAANDLVRALNLVYAEDKDLFELLSISEIINLLFDETGEWYGYTRDARHVLCDNGWLTVYEFYESICDDKGLLEFFMPVILDLCEMRDSTRPEAFFELVYQRLALDKDVVNVLSEYGNSLKSRTVYNRLLESL